ncbi:esterase OVCA2-like isoform X3 [Antedon mediterranea]|uniref:esterase OVCA2-like isoform X3 n=1 Tax=Antedon mediterranea TaxID=105859 RepID=UPI003AF8414D
MCDEKPREWKMSGGAKGTGVNLLKILCVHGYRQNAKAFREKTGSLRKALKRQAEFVYIDAPNTIPVPDEENGILGFSQGASMVGFICSLQCQGDARFNFDFAILVAGFKSVNSFHKSLYEKPVTMPTLHVFGDTDNVIPKEMSEDLLTYFVDPQTVKHPGGHFVPASSPQKKVYIEFLNTFVQKKVAES